MKKFLNRLLSIVLKVFPRIRVTNYLENISPPKTSTKTRSLKVPFFMHWTLKELACRGVNIRIHHENWYGLDDRPLNKIDNDFVAKLPGGCLEVWDNVGESAELRLMRGLIKAGRLTRF
jgi:hypothetical protein